MEKLMNKLMMIQLVFMVFSLSPVLADHHSEEIISDTATIKIIIDENMEMLDGSTLEFKLDENMEMLDGSTLEFKLDENMEMPVKTKARVMNNPNHLMGFKECKGVKDGVAELLVSADVAWKDVQKDPTNKEQWGKADFLSGLAANYSTVYDVWCKEMVNKRVKMVMIKNKKEHHNKKKKEG
jgi:hypothetical protein